MENLLPASAKLANICNSAYSRIFAVGYGLQWEQHPARIT